MVTDWVSFWSNENILKLDCDDGFIVDILKKTQAICFKQVNYMVCEWYSVKLFEKPIKDLNV